MCYIKKQLIQKIQIRQFRQKIFNQIYLLAIFRLVGQKISSSIKIFQYLLNQFVMYGCINTQINSFQNIYNRQRVKGMAKKKTKKSEEEQEQDYLSPESEIKVQKKKKPVAKKQKEENKEKKPKERNRSGAPVGRPKQSKNPIQVKDDPTATIQERILEYLDKIGLKHGLVFRKQERDKMREEKLGIEWNEDHEWDSKKQRSKIQKDTKISQIIQDYIQKFLKEQADNIKWLIEESLINIGDIAAEQCTMEIYYVIAESMQSKIKGDTDKQRDARAKKLLNTLRFMNLNFTNRYEKYWLQFKNDDETKKNTLIEFIELFSDLVNKVDCLFTKKLKDLKQFINEQNWMAEQLQKIKLDAIHAIQRLQRG